MDPALRLNCSQAGRLEGGQSEVSLDGNNDSWKGQSRLSSSGTNSDKENENQINMSIIPNFPNDISLQILARVPRIFYMGMRLVSRSWKSAIMSNDLFSVRKRLGTTEEWLYILTRSCDQDHLGYCLDPLSRKSLRLNVGTVDSASGSSKRSCHGHGGRLPGYGSATLSVDGCLYAFGGWGREGTAALRYAWRYDPVQNRWRELSPMRTGRADCSAEVLNNKIYVVGGITIYEDDGWIKDVPLQSGEVFDPLTGVWSEIQSMPSPEALQENGVDPHAMGMASYKGKLLVPLAATGRGVRGGVVYDPETNSWSQMPHGMSSDWPPSKGPGRKSTAIFNNELYGLDLYHEQSRAARIKVYDEHSDSWRIAFSVSGLPECEYDCPDLFLHAAFLGKLHVISRTYDPRNFIVLQLDIDMLNHHRLHSSPIWWPPSPQEFESNSEPGVRQVISPTSCQVLDV